MDTNLSAGLYKAGRWGYSLNNEEYTNADASGLATSKSFEGYHYRHDTMFSSKYANELASGSMKLISIPIASFVSPDLNGVQSFHLTSTDTNSSNPGCIIETFNQYTRINGDDITFVVKTGDSGSFAGGLTCSYHKQPLSYDRGDFEYKGDDLQTTDINIPEVQFRLTQKPIVPETRKMKATWTQ